MKLIVVAQLITLPVAYLVMNRWLDRFAYRFEPGAAEFLIAAGAVLGIALVTVSYQAIRAATADPVECLSYEYIPNRASSGGRAWWPFCVQTISEKPSCPELISSAG